MAGTRFTLRIAFAALAAAAVLAPTLAQADIYAYTDERGIMHFTNIPGLDRRFKLIRKEGPVAPRAATTSWMPTDAEIKKFSTIIEVAARTHGVDRDLVHAVISAESGYNPNALSRKGASGLMQLMPDTARRYGVDSIFDPAQNIHGGVRYLKDLLAMFNGDVRLAVAGYNAGENAVLRAGRKVPNYAETLAYVPKVLDYYRKFQARRAT